MPEEVQVHTLKPTSKEQSKLEVGTELEAHATTLKDAVNEYRRALKDRPGYHVRQEYRSIDLPPWWYPIFLVGIGIVEWFINYDAFLKNFSVPAIAAGMTVLVALFVALASHEHGAAAKQGRSRFAAYGGSDQNSHWWIFGFASFGIIVALAVVTWVRYVWMLSLFARGVELETAIWPYVLGGLGGNVLVWVIGCMAAFWVHDRSYVLQSFAKEEKKAKRKALKARDRYNRKYKKERQRYDMSGIETQNAAERKLSEHSRNLKEEIRSCAGELEDPVSQKEILTSILKNIHPTD